eukprot:3131832-Ditylum_brightwellii.AAC.1
MSLCYINTLFESALVSVESIVQSTLGFLQSPTTQKHSEDGNKKKTSSKTKKRHKEKLQSATIQHSQANTKTVEEQAQEELKLRGEFAIQTAFMTFTSLVQALQQSSSLQQNGEGETPSVEGCICNALSACIPHVLRHATSMPQDQVMNLVSQMWNIFIHTIPCHEVNTVRALSYESVMVIHLALMEVSSGTWYI